MGCKQFVLSVLVAFGGWNTVWVMIYQDVRLDGCEPWGRTRFTRKRRDIMT